jgi:hypothetical protein
MSEHELLGFVENILEEDEDYDLDDHDIDELEEWFDDEVK